jgi:hypothetical protein
MKATIEFEVPGDDPQDWDTSVEVLCQQAVAKVLQQMNRKPGCVCTALEDADVLRDCNGNICGLVRVETETPVIDVDYAEFEERVLQYMKSGNTPDWTDNNPTGRITRRRFT